jgi:enamine deaminase RidA (YjgF/YER057c/UK114 family)
MATHPIRRTSDERIACSTVDLGDVRHVLVSALPCRGDTLRQQADDVLRAVEAATRREGAGGAIVSQTVFLADTAEIDLCRRMVREFYGDHLPATSYIPQPPCQGQRLAVECLAVGRGRGDVAIERMGEELVIARHNGLTWAHCAAGAAMPPTTAAYDAVTSGLQRIRALLGSADMRFEHVVRTWLYCAGIGQAEGSASRYHELNRARSDFYRDVRFFDGCLSQFHRGRAYPASTGIGAQGRGVLLGALAMAADRDDLVAVPLENPRQTPAYDYTACYGAASPKFSRALAIACGAEATIFISGTASITASETRHPGDPAAQTHETLDNIAALISEANLARHGLPGFGASLEGLGLARMYLKRPDDAAAVRAACGQRLVGVPAVYAVADVCRPELLVEIEGIAFSCRP